MKKAGILIIVFFFCCILNGTPRLLYEYSFQFKNDKYILVHHWSLKNVELSQIDGVNPFIDNNKYAHLLLIEKASGQVVMRMSSSFFTYGWIDQESKYIVLLSNVDMPATTPKIALLTISGEVLFESDISPDEAVLNSDEYSVFKSKYHEYYQQLLKVGRISTEADFSKYYLNFIYPENEPLLKFLKEKCQKNHLSDCITLTNNRMIIWYSQEVIFLQQNGQPPILVGNPNIELVKNRTGDITGISLNDPCEKRITIPVKRKNAEGIYVNVK